MAGRDMTDQQTWRRYFPIRAAHDLADRLAHGVARVVAWLSLVARFRLLQRVDVVIVMPEGGFGHTIYGPDMARRFFANQRCLVLVLSEDRRHNRRVAALWPDLHMVFLPLSFGIPWGRWRISLGDPHQMKPILDRLVRRTVRGLRRSPVQIYSLMELYERVARLALSSEPSDAVPFAYRALIGYFTLLRDVPVPPMRLPRAWQRSVETALGRLGTTMPFGQPIRSCCLYLRQKGLGSSDLTNSRRVGSPPEAYLPAIRLLTEAGYRTLVVGEVDVPEAVYTRYGGMLVDAKRLGVRRDLFALYAGTTADLFIGENGGGLLPPLVNGIPSLSLNAFPYGHGFPNSWVYYKTVRDQEGRLVPLAKLFAEHTHDWELQGMSVHHNSAEEITRAVSCFLEDVAQPQRPDPVAWALALFPSYAMIRQAGNARLSPAFVQFF